MAEQTIFTIIRPDSDNNKYYLFLQFTKFTLLLMNNDRRPLERWKKNEEQKVSEGETVH